MAIIDVIIFILTSAAAQDLELLIGGGGWALQFDGRDDHVALMGDVGPAGNFTIEFWAHPMGLIDGMGREIVKFNEEGVILNQQGEVTKRGFAMNYNGNEVWHKENTIWAIKSDDVDPRSSQAGLFHYAYVRQEIHDQSSASIYINGELAHGCAKQDGSTEDCGEAKDEPLSSEDVQANIFSLPWLLGERFQYQAGAWVFDRPFGGIIDELRWWSTSRTKEQIQSFLHMPVPDDAAGLLQQWRFDEGDGPHDGATYHLGSGDTSKQPQFIPSPVQTWNGPVALSTRVGAGHQIVNLCALVRAVGAHSVSGHVESAIATFQTNPTLGSLTSTSVPLSDAQDGRFCGEATFTPISAGFEEISYVIRVTVNGSAITATQKLAVKIVPNNAPVAGVAKAIRTDGVSGYVSLGSWSLPDSWSVAFWAKPIALAEDSYFISQHLSKGSNIMLFGFYNGGYFFRVDCRKGCNNNTRVGTGRIIAPVGDDDDMVLETGKTAREIRASRGDPHHVALTLNCLTRGDSITPPKARLVIYIDGAAIFRDEAFGACYTNPLSPEAYGSEAEYVPDRPTPWEMGEEYDGGPLDKHLSNAAVVPSNFFNGIIDQLSFWGVELSPQEVLRSAQGGHPQASDVVVEYSFDLDDPYQCAQRQLWQSNLQCFGVNENRGRLSPPAVFPWTQSLIGNAEHVPSPFPLVQGSTVHYTVLEGTCKHYTLDAFDADGDAVSFTILPKHGQVANYSLTGGQLHFCAPVGERADIHIDYDVCDSFGLCASTVSGIGTVTFHVLKRGPRIEAVQWVHEDGVFRVVFDMPTNTPAITSAGSTPTIVVRDQADSLVQILAGTWEIGGSILRLFPAMANHDSDNQISVQVLEAALIRDVAETSFPSVDVSSLLLYESLVCNGGQILLPGIIGCQTCNSFGQETGKCVCSPGFIRSGNASSCEECAPGTFSALPGSSVCSNCTKGWSQMSSGSSKCNRCEVGSFSSNDGATSCTSCPEPLTTEYASADAEEDCNCPEGTFSRHGGPCESCLEGMICKFGSSLENYMSSGISPRSYPMLQDNYWSSPENPLSVFKCSSDKENCPGGAPGSCGEHMVRQACAHCKEGYHMSGIRCKECASAETSKYIFPGIICIVIPLILLTVYLTSNDPIERWGTWKNGVASIVFILLNNYQIISLLSSLDSNSAPSEPRTSVGLWKWSQDQLAIFSVDCAGFRLVSQKMYLKVSGPIYIGVVAVILYVASRTLSACLRQARLAMNHNKMLNVFFGVIYTFFNSVAALALLLFKCVKQPNGVWTLSSDFSVNCYDTGPWLASLYLAIFAILLYIVGFGSLFMWAICHAKNQFSSPSFRSRWKFLFIKYRPEVLWWSQLFILKNVMVNLGFVAFYHVVWQGYFVLSTVLVYTGFVLMFKPYRHRVSNMQEVIACGSIIYCASIFTWFAYKDDYKEGPGLGACFVISTGVPMLVGIFAIAFLATSGLLKNQGKDVLSNESQKTRLRVLEAAKAFVQLEDDDYVVSFFWEHIGEYGRQHFCDMATLVEAELMGSKATRRKTDGLVFEKRVSEKPVSEEPAEKPDDRNKYAAEIALEQHIADNLVKGVVPVSTCAVSESVPVLSNASHEEERSAQCTEPPLQLVVL